MDKLFKVFTVSNEIGLQGLSGYPYYLQKGNKCFNNEQFYCFMCEENAIKYMVAFKKPWKLLLAEILVEHYQKMPLCSQIESKLDITAFWNQYDETMDCTENRTNLFRNGISTFITPKGTYSTKWFKINRFLAQVFVQKDTVIVSDKLELEKTVQFVKEKEKNNENW